MANQFVTYNTSGNYKISSTEIIETIGDSMFYGNMVTQGTLLITPEDGYVLAAADFNVTGDLPAEIESVTFTDLLGAYLEGNTIRVTATFANTFEVTQAYQIINLDIDGSTIETPTEPIAYSVIIEVDTPDFSDVILDPNNNAITPFETDPFDNSDIVEYNIVGEAEANVLRDIGQITVNADNGYQIYEEPYFVYQNMPQDLISLSLVKIVNSSPQITSYTFNIMFKSDVEINEDRSSKAILNFGVKAIPSVITRKNIISAVYGDSNISILGETRPITIYGDPGTEFDITVTKDSDGSSILSTSNANTTILTPEYGSINAINVKLPTGNGVKSFKFNQKFPTNDNILSTTIKTTRTSTTMSLNSSTTNLKVGDQLVYDDITDVDNISGTGNAVPVVIQSITSAANVVLHAPLSPGADTASLIQSSSDPVKFRRSEKYYINIYPKSGVTLGSNIPNIQPHFTLNQPHRPQLTLAATAGGNYTLTTYSKITYLGKVGAKGSQLQTLAGVSGTTATAKNQKNLFSVTWVATSSDPASHTFTTADNPVWSSTKLYDSGDSTSSDFDNQGIADNGGTHVEIFNLNTSLNSSGTANTIATITFDVLIKKFGDRDVLIHLPTSRFLTCA
tara:strand:- start:2707 stop:4572 length:1866 start_codon:yes stop_codon:yes gene_type:complete